MKKGASSIGHTGFSEVGRDVALRALKDPTPRSRLTAARYLVRAGLPTDLPVLTEALQRETVAWIRTALEEGIRRLSIPIEGGTAPLSETYQPDQATEAHAQAIAEVSGQLVHELEPLIGILRLRLITEWPDFLSSRAEAALDQIDSFLTALHELNVAAQVPALEELSLRGVLEKLVAELPAEHGRLVSLSGPELGVCSNANFLQLIVRNGVRNAIEIMEPNIDPKVVVSWGSAADEGFFISIIDQGPGPPPGADPRAFDVGSSTKRGHLGMGLAIAQQAAEALGGTLTLRPGKTGGSVLRFSSHQASK